MDNQWLLLILVAMLVLIILISWINATAIKRNDFHSVKSLITASIHIVDTYSDALFILTITNQSVHPSTESVILVITSILFVALPLIITLFQLQHEINKWRRNNDLGQWIADNAHLLYFISVITGSSFAGVELCISNLFNLQIFDMPLNQIQMNKFRTKRVWSTILIENIPQLVIQIFFIFFIRDNHKNDQIVFIAMTFSILSVIICIFSIISQRKIIRSTDYVSIEFDATGLLDVRQCRNRVEEIRHSLSSSFGLNSNLFDIQRPKQIQHGLKMTINIKIDNVKQIDMNMAKL